MIDEGGRKDVKSQAILIVVSSAPPSALASARTITFEMPGTIPAPSTTRAPSVRPPKQDTARVVGCRIGRYTLPHDPVATPSRAKTFSACRACRRSSPWIYDREMRNLPCRLFRKSGIRADTAQTGRRLV